MLARKKNCSLFWVKITGTKKSPKSPKTLGYIFLVSIDLILDSFNEMPEKLLKNHVHYVFNTCIIDNYFNFHVF